MNGSDRSDGVPPVPGLPGRVTAWAHPGSPRGRTRWGRVSVLVGVAVGIAAIVVAGTLLTTSLGSPANVTGTSRSSPQLASVAQLDRWQNVSTADATAYASNDTLWMHPGAPQLLIVMSPEDHGMTFVVNGLVNPTIHVPVGEPMAVRVVNMDPSMTHDWILSTQAPPYGEYPMMGGGMMAGSYGMWGSTMMGEPQGGMYWSQSMGFTLSTPGDYWYLCTYPGQAAGGMFGAFVAG